MTESYALVSSMIATSIPVFLEDLIYIIILLGIFVWLLRFMERNKMFERNQRERRKRR